MGKSVSKQAKKKTDQSKKTTTVNKKTRPPKLLLTLPTPSNGKSPYLDLENKAGVEVIFKPFFEISGVTCNNFRKQKLNLKDVSAIILTSKTTVDHLFRLIEELKFKIPEDFKYFCKSEAVALYLQKFIQYRKRKVFISSDSRLSGLLEILDKHKDSEQFMYCGSDNTHDTLYQYLEENNFDFQKSVLYNIVPSEEVIELKKDRWDCIVFFSPNAVKIFLDHVDFFTNDGLKIAAFGPATVEELETNGFKVDLQAPSPEYASMVDALSDYFK